MGPKAAKSLAKSLGKLFANLKNPRWQAAAVSSTGTSILLIGPMGKQISATLRGHFHHDEGKLGDHYTDQDGNEYIVVGDKKYRYDPQSDSFHHA
jgi:hypothetical protein